MAAVFTSPDGRVQYRIVSNGERYATDKRVQTWLFGWRWGPWRATGGEWGDIPYDDVFDTLEEAQAHCMAQSEIRCHQAWEPV